MNHIDEFKNMTVEEFAKWISTIADCVACEMTQNAKCRYHLHQGGKSCYQCWFEWLNSNAEENKHE